MSLQGVLGVGESIALVVTAAVGELGGFNDSNQGHVGKEGLNGPVLQVYFSVVQRTKELLLLRVGELLQAAQTNGMPAIVDHGLALIQVEQFLAEKAFKEVIILH